MSLKGKTSLFARRSLICLLLLLVGGLGACRKRQDASPNTTPPVPGREPTIRVKILNDTKTCKLRTDSPFTAKIRSSAPGQEQEPQERFATPANDIEISASAGTFQIGSKRIEAKKILIETDGPRFFTLNGDEYRGALQLIMNDSGDSLDAVNHLGLESYLAGVVGAEMPDYWEPEALKAQTVAARTYCLYIKKRFGARRTWDVSKTQAHQVYRGMEAESAPVKNAIDRTKGKVLTCTQPNAAEGIFPTYYSSACGGHTENSRNVFGDSFAPLVGVACPHCMDVARPKYYFWPNAKFSVQAVSDKLIKKYPNLKELGRISNIEVSAKTDFGPYSRLTRIKLSGPQGKTDSVRAEDLRLTIDPTGRILRSTICQISKSGNQWLFQFGRGFGHGVGMCQCGVQAMARKGHKAEQILAYYYPDSKIAEIY